jgi:Na+-transporting methylmalonyl-CoA/oxaloacetate decarboxylase gamma subunit
MSDTIVIALQITVVGMGLVFAAILMLWLVMALLVRFTSSPWPQEDLLAAERDRKQRAAAAAVATALSERSAAVLRRFPLPPTALVSAWQAVSRANHLRRGGRTR